MALVVFALAVPPAAQAAGPAAVTVSACRADSVTVAGKVKLTGRSARKVRGARLQLRFQAMPLFGLPRTGHWRSNGKKTRASRQESFTALPADNWIGVMSWRFKKGRKTVASGLQRSEKVRVGRARGRASCTIAEGAKPVDTTPPALFILPADEVWHRAPATVQLLAQDDFSGVRAVRYSLDGGPKTQIPNGGTFGIATEGAHAVDFEATDVAGNTATRNAVVRVDGAPPTKPVVTRPGSVTASTTPTFEWTASTDSGSGVKEYRVAITRASDGALIAVQPVSANTTSLVSPATLTDGETYTVTVRAIDNTVPEPWTIDSDPLTFRVDSQANVTSVSPAAGSVLAGTAKDSTFTLSLDRPADPASVSKTTVILDRNAESGSDPSYTVGCANTSCTAITVDPASALGEGRYVLGLNGVKSGDGEGLTFQPFSAAYSVPFLEDADGVDVGGGVCIGNSMTTTAVVNAADASETGTLDFDWSYGSGAGWQVRALKGAMQLGSPVAGGPGSGHSRLSFPIPSGSNTITFEFTSVCSSGNAGALDTNNLIGARLP